jgi:tRNA-specific 2-thiouridylase
LISRDIEKNIVFVGEGRNFPGLFRSALKIENSEVHWVREDLRLQNGESMKVKARIRYRQTLEEATLYQFEEGLYIEFKNPQSAIAEGQFAAWHDGEELLGSGVIA